MVEPVDESSALIEPATSEPSQSWRRTKRVGVGLLSVVAVAAVVSTASPQIPRKLHAFASRSSSSSSLPSTEPAALSALGGDRSAVAAPQKTAAAPPLSVLLGDASGISNSDYEHMEKVLAALVEMSFKEKITCSNVTYAYCAEAMCRPSGVDGVAVCGCVNHEGQAGEIALDYASLTLLRSKTYRESVLLLVDGKIGHGEELMCNALRDGMLWREAGYASTSYGSYFNALDDRRKQRRLGDGSSSSSSSSSSGVLEVGSCMGAPCRKDLAWNSESCDVTCMCPSFTASSEASGMCFMNGITKGKPASIFPWDATVMSILKYTEKLASRLKHYDPKTDEYADKCNWCSVRS